MGQEVTQTNRGELTKEYHTPHEVMHSNIRRKKRGFSSVTHLLYGNWLSISLPTGRGD